MTRSVDTSAYTSTLAVPAGWSLSGCGEGPHIPFE